MKDSSSKQKSRRGYSKHGLTVLKHAVKQLGNRVIDKRTVTGRELAKWRNELIADLGGPDNISTQQRTLIDLAGATKLIHDSTTAWILSQPSPINARKRSLLPVVLQRQTLADSLARYLSQLGLHRRQKIVTLASLLAEQQKQGNGKD